MSVDLRGLLESCMTDRPTGIEMTSEAIAFLEYKHCRFEKAAEDATSLSFYGIPVFRNDSLSRSYRLLWPTLSGQTREGRRA